eukprot:GHRR01002625.1.p1 GENE.GHRR01002625.1~~GHRR01002625.1.p1  ORF type:complete len:782 (+),score=274.94 GHRR01002625.1:429-2774(+)
MYVLSTTGLLANRMLGGQHADDLDTMRARCDTSQAVDAGYGKLSMLGAQQGFALADTSTSCNSTACTANSIAYLSEAGALDMSASSGLGQDYDLACIIRKRPATISKNGQSYRDQPANHEVVHVAAVATPAVPSPNSNSPASSARSQQQQTIPFDSAPHSVTEEQTPARVMHSLKEIQTSRGSNLASQPASPQQTAVELVTTSMQSETVHEAQPATLDTVCAAAADDTAAEAPEDPADKCSVFFARVPPTVPYESILALFQQFGTVKSLNLFRPWASAKTSKGCGIVDYDNPEAAAAAMVSLHTKYHWTGGETTMVVEWMDPARHCKDKQGMGKDGKPCSAGKAGSGSKAAKNRKKTTRPGFCGQLPPGALSVAMALPNAMAPGCRFISMPGSLMSQTAAAAPYGINPGLAANAAALNPTANWLMGMNDASHLQGYNAIVGAAGVAPQLVGTGLLAGAFGGCGPPMLLPGMESAVQLGGLMDTLGPAGQYGNSHVPVAAAGAPQWVSQAALPAVSGMSCNTSAGVNSAWPLLSLSGAAPAVPALPPGLHQATAAVPNMQGLLLAQQQRQQQLGSMAGPTGLAALNGLPPGTNFGLAPTDVELQHLIEKLTNEGNMGSVGAANTASLGNITCASGRVPAPAADSAAPGSNSSAGLVSNSGVNMASVLYASVRGQLQQQLACSAGLSAVSNNNSLFCAMENAGSNGLSSSSCSKLGLVPAHNEAQLQAADAAATAANWLLSGTSPNNELVSAGHGNYPAHIVASCTSPLPSPELLWQLDKTHV